MRVWLSSETDVHTSFFRVKYGSTILFIADIFCVLFFFFFFDPCLSGNGYGLLFMSPARHK
jgi:hypothetical protein